VTERRGIDISRALEIERGRIISHSVENSLCKRLWTCRKPDGMSCMNYFLTNIF
jgi:hypothetical protein